ncbi:MAG: IS4 family transposase [Anaerolinea sp.]|nr:IS4 family transposase [Anaerolinea sp.]
MRRSHPGSFRQQARFLRRQFLQDGDLPSTSVLTEEVITDARATVGDWLDRIFSPVVTLWVFLGQVLDADHSCRAAVARLIAHRVARGLRPCSARTGAYCRARERLPEAFFSEAALRTGRALDDGVNRQWLWKDRRVCVYDGSSVTMPDTPANQAAYPQPVAQKPGLGFPLARLAAVLSLACGAVVGLGIRRYAGQGQSELGILRKLLDVFRPGDVVLADRLMCAWTEMVMLKRRGVGSVCRFTSHRKADFRRGRRRGEGDHVVEWPRPPKPRSIDRDADAALPASLTARECRVRVDRPGFRVRVPIVATTLLSPNAYARDDLAGPYRARWNAELDLRSLKQALQMDVLRCKTPGPVRKGLWAHILAYNLIRTIMAQAAVTHDAEPRSISFTGAVQALEAFQPAIALMGEGRGECREAVYGQIRDAIASHQVADRPDRYEPRRRKRRPKPYDRLMVPRHEAKRQVLKGVREK